MHSMILPFGPFDIDRTDFKHGLNQLSLLNSHRELRHNLRSSLMDEDKEKSVSIGPILKDLLLVVQAEKSNDIFN